MNTRYRRGGMFAADMAYYARELSETNTNAETLARLKRNLIIAMRQEVTEQQRKYLYLYYSKQLSMKEIAEQEGVDKSTVSRTIRRGETNLRRCLRFGAAELLVETADIPPYRTVEGLARREGYENVPPEQIPRKRKRYCHPRQSKKKKEVHDSYVDDY